MKNCSCTTNLLEFLEEVTAKADSSKSINIIYLDFCEGVRQGSDPETSEETKGTWSGRQSGRVDRSLAN